MQKLLGALLSSHTVVIVKAYRLPLLEQHNLFKEGQGDCFSSGIIAVSVLVVLLYGNDFICGVHAMSNVGI